MKLNVKLGLLIATVLGTLAWLGLGGVNETKTYYKTINELNAMGLQAHGQRMRVVGDVEPHSIKKLGNEVHFQLRDGQRLLPVVYRGIDPLPDTFRDRAQALADGKMSPDGTFEAQKIQAKCASKYEAKLGEKKKAEGATAAGAPRI